MAKALLGTHVDPTTLRLVDEVRTLRRRVAELEAALEAAESARVDRATREGFPLEADREAHASA